MAITAAHPRQTRPPRITELDALRGVALLGILLVNAMMMAGPYGLGTVADPDASVFDRTVEGLVHTFVAGKFYLLFSFLFGYSFTLQLESAERDGARAVPRHLRRTLGLFALGALHAVLLYVGDILMTYALLGLILMAARTCSPRAARRAALIVHGCAGALLLLLGALFLLMPDAAAAELDAELTADFPALVAAYQGDAVSVVRANLNELPDALFSTLLMGGFVLAAFLIGVDCGKRRLLTAAGTGSGTEDPGARVHSVRRLRRGCLLGAVVGLPGGVFMALTAVGLPGPRWAVFGQAVGTVTAPALTAAYVCGTLLFLRGARGGRASAFLAPAGRMALTNYLGQSLVMALVFTGYGLALYDRLGPAVVVLGVFVLYAAQLALSTWLMARYRYGPVEWLLRTVTLARLPHARPRPDAEAR
ncbi:DUF418 domain-containing protein [Streptomyces sp. NPDC101490]|uniref:DUF418 domain-containing protein n=1 Tax=Streptomyces sp. NPDC101490 TaxID=3366143 RepID=UPI0037F4C1EB